MYSLAAVGIGLFQLCEHLTEAACQFLVALEPLCQTFFQCLLLANDVEVGNGLVHADGVFPVVAAAGVFAGILDSGGAVRVHPFLPDFLFLSAYLYGGYVAVVYAFADSPRAEVAAGASGIAHGHAVVAGTVSVNAYFSISLGLQWHVVLAVFCGLAVLVCIDAEHAEVAGLAGPHPVVCVAAELAQRLCGGEDQTHVAVGLILRYIERIAAVVASYHAVHARIGTTVFALHSVADGVGLGIVDFPCGDGGVGTVDAVQGGHDARGAFLGALQKTHEQTLGGAFLFHILCHESVGQNVIFRGRKCLDGTETAVVVGEHQSVGADHNAGTEVTEVDYGIFQAYAVGVVQF